MHNLILRLVGIALDGMCDSSVGGKSRSEQLVTRLTSSVRLNLNRLSSNSGALEFTIGFG